MKTGTTNENMRELIRELKLLSHKENVKIWGRVAEDLEKSSRQRRIVNISRINRFTEDGETIVVPGKVLGSGILKRKINVAAFSFSDTAKEAIERAKGSAISLKDLIKQNPKGQKVRIIG